MICEFFIGDAFMAQDSAISQTEYRFVGAKKNDNGKYEISVIIVIANGYAGGSSCVTWEMTEGDKIKVSEKMKGCFVEQGLTKQKIKKRNIKEILFRNIEKDVISIEFID